MEIFCDGACEPVNPNGYATWGFVAYGENGFEKHAAHGLIGHGSGMTNQVAEYTAVIEALKWAYKAGYRGFTIKTDSQLVVNQVKGAWKVNAEHLRKFVDRAVKGLQACESQGRIEWVPREQNMRADELSKLAYKEASGTISSEYQEASGSNEVFAEAIRDLDAMPDELEDGFEADFVISNLERIAKYGDDTRFSDKQKAVIIKLVEKYLGVGRAAEMQGQMRLIG